MCSSDLEGIVAGVGDMDDAELLEQPIRGVLGGAPHLLPDQVDILTGIIMPNGKISDVPVAYREQYLAFLEQSQKVAAARKKLGWFGLKARLLSFLEHQDLAVQLAQGKLDGVLSGIVGKA